MSTTVSPSNQKAGFVEDLVDMFVAPSAVYERRRNDSAWIPLLFVSVTIGLMFYFTSGALQPIMDAEYQRGAKAMLDAGMTAEQVAQGRTVAQKFAMSGYIGGTPIAILFCGIGLLLTSKLVDAKVKLGTATMIAAWAFVPRVIGGILSAVQLRFMQTESLDGFYRLSVGPARFMDPDTASPLLLGVLGRFDLFVLWTTLLIGIGVSVVARVSRSNGIIAAAGVWFLGSLTTLFGALR